MVTRYVGHPKVIIQGDSEHALMAVIHDACALLTAATPRTSLVKSKGSNGAAEREQYTPLRGWLATLRLDLLGRTHIAVGSDLPIYIVDGETRGTVVESFPNWISRWKDGVCTTVRKNLRITCATFR